MTEKPEQAPPIIITIPWPVLLSKVPDLRLA